MKKLLGLLKCLNILPKALKLSLLKYNHTFFQWHVSHNLERRIFANQITIKRYDERDERIIWPRPCLHM